MNGIWKTVTSVVTIGLLLASGAVIIAETAYVEDDGAQLQIDVNEDRDQATVDGMTLSNVFPNQVDTQTEVWIDGGSGPTIGTTWAQRTEYGSVGEFCGSATGNGNHWAILDDESWEEVKLWDITLYLSSCPI